MKRSELADLRLNFRTTVVFGPNWRTAMPCWFGRHIETPQDCEGRVEAAHWIKRQRVRNALKGILPMRELILEPAAGFEEYGSGLELIPQSDLVELAEWDPRNAVPACEKHHRRFDSQRMPPLVVPREAVPAHVEEFVADWGLESALEQKCPRQEAMTHEH